MAAALKSDSELGILHSDADCGSGCCENDHFGSAFAHMSYSRKKTTALQNLKIN